MIWWAIAGEAAVVILLAWKYLSIGGRIDEIEAELVVHRRAVMAKRRELSAPWRGSGGLSR